MKRSTIIIASLFTIASITVSCKSSSETTERSGQRKGGERPDLETIFAQLDTNEDGFISKEELKNAPKPERKRERRN